MKKEYRDKFGNFVHEERKKEEETLAICEDILKNSRNEMAVAMRFLQSAFGALKPIISGETGAMGTDGKLLYAAPGWLIEIFMKDRVRLNHMYLHEVLHCLFNQSRRISCRLFRKKLDFCLHLTTHIFPFFLAACHPALILRCIPEMMVIHPKFLLQTDNFIFLT